MVTPNRDGERARERLAALIAFSWGLPSAESAFAVHVRVLANPTAATKERLRGFRPFPRLVVTDIGPASRTLHTLRADGRRISRRAVNEWVHGPKVAAWILEGG